MSNRPIQFASLLLFLLLLSLILLLLFFQMSTNDSFYYFMSLFFWLIFFLIFELSSCEQFNIFFCCFFFIILIWLIQNKVNFSTVREILFSKNHSEHFVVKGAQLLFRFFNLFVCKKKKFFFHAFVMNINI